MNQQPQGHGPSIIHVQGRTFLIVELPTAPPTPPFLPSVYEQNIGMPMNDPWPAYEMPNIPLPPFIPLDPSPPVFDPLPDLPTMDQNIPFPALDNNFFPLENWSPGRTPPCTTDGIPSAYPAPSTGPKFYPSTPSDTPTPESTATYYSLPSSTPVQPVDAFSSPAQAPMPQTIPLGRNSEEIASSTHSDTNHFHCPLSGCDKTVSKRRTMHRHLWAKHRDYARENNIPSEEDTCLECGEAMRRDNIPRHMEKKHMKRHSRSGRRRVCR